MQSDESLGVLRERSLFMAGVGVVVNQRGGQKFCDLLSWAGATFF